MNADTIWQLIRYGLIAIGSWITSKVMTAIETMLPQICHTFIVNAVLGAEISRS